MTDRGFDTVKVEDLVILLLDKTEEYMGLVGNKDADATKVHDLKLQIENLKAIIGLKRLL